MGQMGVPRMPSSAHESGLAVRLEGTLRARGWAPCQPARPPAESARSPRRAGDSQLASQTLTEAALVSLATVNTAPGAAGRSRVAFLAFSFYFTYTRMTGFK